MCEPRLGPSKLAECEFSLNRCSKWHFKTKIRTRAGRYLQLKNPGAVPVGHILPFNEELPLRATSQWLGVRNTSWEVTGPRHRGRERRFTPAPGQDLLHLTFHSRTLEGKIRYTLFHDTKGSFHMKSLNLYFFFYVLLSKTIIING